MVLHSNKLPGAAGSSGRLGTLGVLKYNSSFQYGFPTVCKDSIVAVRAAIINLTATVEFLVSFYKICVPGSCQAPKTQNFWDNPGHLIFANTSQVILMCSLCEPLLKSKVSKTVIFKHLICES